MNTPLVVLAFAVPVLLYISLPLLGNVVGMPKGKPWVVYRDLCASYGPVVHLNILGQSIVVLGDPRTISELLEKRSAHSSDRKQTPLVDLIGASWNFTWMAYGTRWRRHRRAFWQYFNQNAVQSAHDTQRDAARRFLGAVLDEPARVEDHVKFTFAATVLKVLYGIEVEAGDPDGYVAAVGAALEGVSQGMVPGRFAVEYLPFLKTAPAWVPGSGEQRMFKKWQAAGDVLKQKPFGFVKREMTNSQE
ncbi:cytochrome P450 [Epithele typhae]|uniref:cytochrome P450 n=1 Tax=Epithele typhae TaxID=378194 RepID=UPI002007B587|nr:cytochrome P450 [Epithele typhae]KAH9929053.1 cytochrome P450 [Epithele typhae]